MSEEYRKGMVYIQGIYAGVIAETDEGYTFSYDRAYLETPDAVPASLTLPLTDTPIILPFCFHFLMV